jgi:hypothetical protein
VLKSCRRAADDIVTGQLGPNALSRAARIVFPIFEESSAELTPKGVWLAVVVTWPTGSSAVSMAPPIKVSVFGNTNWQANPSPVTLIFNFLRFAAKDRDYCLREAPAVTRPSVHAHYADDDGLVTLMSIAQLLEKNMRGPLPSPYDVRMYQSDLINTLKVLTKTFKEVHTSTASPQADHMHLLWGTALERATSPATATGGRPNALEDHNADSPDDDDTGWSEDDDLGSGDDGTMSITSDMFSVTEESPINDPGRLFEYKTIWGLTTMTPRDRDDLVNDNLVSPTLMDMILDVFVRPQPSDADEDTKPGSLAHTPPREIPRTVKKTRVRPNERRISEKAKRTTPPRAHSPGDGSSMHDPQNPGSPPPRTSKRHANAHDEDATAQDTLSPSA